MHSSINPLKREKPIRHPLDLSKPSIDQKILSVLYIFSEEKKLKATLKDIGIALLAAALCFFVMYGQWIFLPV